MTLTIQDLGALGELLGSVAVLFTLVYLAMQTRQNTMAIEAQLDAARIGSSQQLYLTAATSKELQEALNEDRVSDIPISRARRETYWGAQLIGVHWQFLQARRGLLPSFNEAGAGGAVGGNFRRYGSYAEYWDRRKRGFLPDFVEWVEEQRAKATTAAGRG